MAYCSLVQTVVETPMYLRAAKAFYGAGFLCRDQGDAMSKLFEEMANGTAEARAYMAGKRKGYKVTLPETVDVRGIRKRLRLSQERFADRFGLSVDAVRHWESGRRQPEAAARALLTLIAADPQFVMRTLAKSA
jgi:putative transcriptional regulator